MASDNAITPTSSLPPIEFLWKNIYLVFYFIFLFPYILTRDIIKQGLNAARYNGTHDVLNSDPLPNNPLVNEIGFD